MRLWGILLTIAMGFLVGFGLAGIGGISAGLQAAQKKSATDINKIEDFWARTDLNESELRKLVNNDSCHLSEKYFLACVNSVISALSATEERLGQSGEILKSSSDLSSVDNFKEKEILLPFAKIYQAHLDQQFSFEKLWDQVLTRANSKLPLRYLVAQGINGYLSVTKDPHTYILPLDYFEQVSLTSERSLYFVGLRFEKVRGVLKLKQVIHDSDADLGGLKVDDVVISINGITADKLNIADATQILKDKETRVFNFIVKREGVILVKNVPRSYRVLSQVNSQILSADRNIGLISISKFSKNTCKDVEKAIIDMSDKNISGLILDLRDNPGGHLSEASCLTGLFIGENKRVYSVQYFDVSKSSEVVLTANNRIYSGPLAVLVNNNSASASELFAGAIQEYRRGLIIGSKTFGKGTFQEVESWGDSKSIGFFKTKGFYLLPNGDSTQFYGINPDIEISSGNTVVSNEEINYMNPIKPINLIKTTKKLDLSLQKCESKSSEALKDQVLAKAVESLTCRDLMSYVALKYTSDLSTN